MPNIKNPTDFANALLGELGFPDSKTNVDNILGWYNAEGGNWNNTAKHNPLNTTQQETGSSVMSGGNSSGVQSYPNWKSGLDATVATLETPGHGYSQILADLNTSQSWNKFATDVSKSGWGTKLVNSSTPPSGSPNSSAYGAGATAAEQSGAAANSLGKGSKSKDYHGFAGTLQTLDKMYNPVPDSKGIWKFIPNVPSDISSLATMVFTRSASSVLFVGIIFIGIKMLVNGSTSSGGGGGGPTNVLEFVNASQQSNRRIAVQESHETRLGNKQNKGE